MATAVKDRLLAALEAMSPDQQLSLCRDLEAAQSQSRPDDADDDFYKVTSPQGLCLVINIKKYEAGTNCEERLGSELDVQRVERVFRDLNFHVIVRQDLKCHEIARLLNEVAFHQKLSAYGCFICFVMAHGELGKIIDGDGMVLEIRSITERFRPNQCPNLSRKPKLFFIQACRGVSQNICRPAPADSQQSNTAELYCPQDSDFLLCYSSTEGYKSYRDERKGSPFVQTLCQVVEEKRHDQHILDIMTKVNQLLNANPIDVQGSKLYLVSQTVSQLSKKCSLNPGRALQQGFSLDPPELSVFTFEDRESSQDAQVGKSASNERLQDFNRISDKFIVTSPQGLCLVINFNIYNPSTGFSDRKGSEIDVTRVTEVFRKLNFQVVVHENLKGHETAKILAETALSSDLLDHGCFVCFIMANGESGRIICSDGAALDIQSITERFRPNQCIGLRHKPKLFIFQACRGQKIDYYEEKDEMALDGLPIEETSTQYCPQDSDFLLCYSSTDGMASFRNVMKGAHFVQTLCDVIEERNQQDDILHILTRVIGILKQTPLALRPYGWPNATCTMVPEFVSRLSKQCFLNPGLANS